MSEEHYLNALDHSECSVSIFVPCSFHSATVVAGRRLTSRVAPTATQVRTLIGENLVGKPDNLIPTDRDHRFKKPKMPADVPEALKKDLEALGLDAPSDLDELEEEQAGFQESGLVPPDTAGTFASPIMIPSRLHERAVGYTDPTTHAVFWFNIHDDGNVYYIKDLGLFFKMFKVEGEEE